MGVLSITDIWFTESVNTGAYSTNDAFNIWILHLQSYESCRPKLKYRDQRSLNRDTSATSLVSPGKHIHNYKLVKKSWELVNAPQIRVY